MEEGKKICTKCEIEKPLSDFSNCKRGKYNKQPKCKECNKLYREANRDKILDYLNTYYQENKEELTIKNSQRAKDNSEQVATYKKIWYEQNKSEIAKKAKERYIRNIDSIKEYKREYYSLNKKELVKKSIKNRKKRLKKDILFFIQSKISNAIRRSVSKKTKKSKRSADILGLTIEEFREYIESLFEPWMNWGNYGKYNGELNYGWDLDHIIPSSSAKNEEEIYLLNYWTNFQPLCSKVNRDIKKDKINE